MIEYTVKVNSYGDKQWLLNGKLHRENGPAIEWSNEWSNGNKLWYLNGQRHREDGPAVELADGTKRWYLNDQKLTKEEWEKKTQHTIIIDGKTIQLSKESCQNLKQAIGK